MSAVVALLSVVWAVLPWAMVVLLLFVGRNMLRRIEDLEAVVADYVDAFEPDEDD